MQKKNVNVTVGETVTFFKSLLQRTEIQRTEIQRTAENGWLILIRVRVLYS